MTELSNCLTSHKTKDASKSQSLSTKTPRKDLIYKALIRSVKRFYCDKLCNGKALVYKLSSEDSLICLRNIDEVRILFLIFIVL